MNKELDKQNIDRLRSIRIHRIFNLPDTGRRITMRCPVHLGTGKSPSFNVYNDGSYFCFGCGISGSNVIDLLIAMGSNFGEAIEYLKGYE